MTPTPRPAGAREAERARLLAERILDRWHGDPDDDLAILARAVVRLNEAAAIRAESSTIPIEQVAAAMADPLIGPMVDKMLGRAESSAEALRTAVQRLVDEGPHWTPNLKERVPRDDVWGVATVAVADLRAALRDDDAGAAEAQL